MANINNDKVLNFSSEREQQKTCPDVAEREKNQGTKVLNRPPLRFPEFSGEWEKTTLAKECAINPPTPKLAEKFVYVDLESVSKGQLVKLQVIAKEEAPSRAQRVLSDNDVIFQCVRPYQKNNYLYHAPQGEMQWVASTGYAQLRTIQNIPSFIYHVLNTNSFNKKVMVRCTGSSYPAINSEDLSKIPFYKCSIKEQEKIASFLLLIDGRISTQIGLIEDLKKLMSAIIHHYFDLNVAPVMELSKCLKQHSERNKQRDNYPVLSVSNKSGFVSQSEQFEDRTIASEDTSNYKIVDKDMFAYNPARINVGSIARYTSEAKGIVSPMYVCFRTNDMLLPQYFEYYFHSTAFKHEMYKRLEGSVRLCLTFESLVNIKIALPTIDEQTTIAERLSAIEKKIAVETAVKDCYVRQRQYLLSQMFV